MVHRRWREIGVAFLVIPVRRRSVIGLLFVISRREVARRAAVARAEVLNDESRGGGGGGNGRDVRLLARRVVHFSSRDGEQRPARGDE